MHAVADWVTISALATAGGTLALAVSTFGSVRSANRAARAAERSLLAGLRPLLVPSRSDDPVQKVPYSDDHWEKLPGSGAIASVADDVVYFAISLRNIATGLAVLHGWRLHAGWYEGGGERPPVEDFHRLTRDLYIPAGDLGYWHGALRDPSSAEFREAADAIGRGERLTIDVLYGDQEGGQRVISRMALRPLPDGRWLAVAGRHWQLDRSDPR
jgi:hypothetical protein